VLLCLLDSEHSSVKGIDKSVITRVDGTDVVPMRA